MDFELRDKSNETKKFTFSDESNDKRDILKRVYASLEKKGYNPINQLVGYIISEDPTYITNHEGARALIVRLDRDELLQDMLRRYLLED